MPAVKLCGPPEGRPLKSIEVTPATGDFWPSFATGVPPRLTVVAVSGCRQKRRITAIRLHLMAMLVLNSQVSVLLAETHQSGISYLVFPSTVQCTPIRHLLSCKLQLGCASDVPRGKR